MPDVKDGHVEVGDRRVDFCLYNVGSPRRAVVEYGTPGTRWLSTRQTTAAKSEGFELLVIDRPGYGTTSRRRGRRIVDVVDDVCAVLGAVGWERFALWGGSGGAPHALAIASRLPDRVSACASVVGPAPYDARGLNWYARMSSGNVAEFTAAARGEDAYRPLVERIAEEAIATIEAGGIQVAADYELPESDRRALDERRAEEGYLERMRATYVGGVDGWIDDCIAMTRPWGFDLAEIAVPTSVWYGVDDVLGPRAHAEHLLDAILMRNDVSSRVVMSSTTEISRPCTNGSQARLASRTLDGTRVALSRDFAAERRPGVPQRWFGDVCRSRDVKTKHPGSRFGTGAGVRIARGRPQSRM
jgi:pimeloyl-ACP methyl ester carboxylesterase